ncbi:MAG: RNA helicase [Acidimicrobiales bacterium]|nr:MAG: RNA helicase [Acidimicrobiales bacterium]
MTSPAELYSQARNRRAYPVLAEFASAAAFPLDDFQREACQALESGSSVLVCAPTGAGKTIVGEFAIQLGRHQQRKCFYTTPIKALSNQKYHDLVRVYGSEQVGLLTGDNSINGDAPIVVMTTEVLRNMLYVGSQALLGLGYVVMDEVHYLADRFRGAVWEEVIIHLPESVVLVSLSATVSNAEEFGDWLVTVRGATQVVVSEHRPVPLWQHMLVGKRMFDLFASPDDSSERSLATKVNPQLLRHTSEALRRISTTSYPRSGSRHRQGRGGPQHRVRANGIPNRADVIARLDREGLLPTITFIFSRVGCDSAVRQCVRSELRLTDGPGRAEIARIAAERTSKLSAEDLQALGYWEWREGLMRGFAAHHAGMLPVFKEVVEELFVAGLVKAVFATETLALGINMPARSVVLERLVKFNGEQHADISAGEYTQLTGRAGRRGIDVDGHAVVLWSPEIDPRSVAGLASTRTYPLVSSFKPSYNMAVNLVATIGTSAARALLETSFAQFQTDKSVVGLARQIRRNIDAIAGYTEAMHCDRGDFAEYAQLGEAIKQREKALSRDSTALRHARLAFSLEQLRIGDVIQVPGGRRAGLAVVLEAGSEPLREPRLLVLTEDRWAGRLCMADFTDRGGVDVVAICRVTVPHGFNHRSPQQRRDLAASLRNAVRKLDPVDQKSGRSRSRKPAADDDELARLRAALRSHPCHSCPQRDEHTSWAWRCAQLQADTDKLQLRVSHRTSSLAREFDQVCAILHARGYLKDTSRRRANDDAKPLDSGEPSQVTVTDAGRQLCRIWSESDLLVAECLRLGVWDALDAAELAAAVSALLYEPRGSDATPIPVPSGRLSVALERTAKLWGELNDAESERGLGLTKQPDVGFVRPILRWARGESLQRVLTANIESRWRADSSSAELAAGDFVRWARQVIDLLDQVWAVAPANSALRSTASTALAAVRRGVLAGRTDGDASIDIAGKE